MRFDRIGWLGLVPAMAVGLLVLGTRIGAVPFNHIPGVGWTLAAGALLLGLAALGQVGQRRWWAVIVLVPIAAAQGVGAWWALGDPAGVGAQLVRSHDERMGELLVGYVDIYGDAPQVGPLVEELVERAPYHQVFVFHGGQPHVSEQLGLADACVARLSRDGPREILEHLDEAQAAFGHEIGRLAPLAAVLDMRSTELDHDALASNLAVLYDISPPGGEFSRLAAQLAAVVAEERQAMYDELAPGDRAFADLVIAAAQSGTHSVMLDSRGAPAGTDVLAGMLRAHYLAAIPGGGGERVIHLRYRELRAGEIIQTSRGARPVDLVSATLTLRFDLAGEVIYENAFRGDSPLDAWQNAPSDATLRGVYRQAAIDALNAEIAVHFADLRVP